MTPRRHHSSSHPGRADNPRSHAEQDSRLRVVPGQGELRRPLRFTLVMATVGRVHEIAGFLEALTTQTYPHFDVVIVDQNGDDRLLPLLDRYHESLRITHVRSAIGLSRARNVGLQYVTGDIIGFPDDDCTYPEDLLERVVDALAPDRPVDGIAILPHNPEGEPFPRLHRKIGRITPYNAFRRCVSIGLFFRASLVKRTGLFNEELGLGAGTLWASAEDVDYPLRALLAGGRIEYRPDIAVTHAFGVHGRPTNLARLGSSLGGGVGYVLRRHRFPLSTTIEIMLVRPAGGLLLGIVHGSWSEVCFYAGTLYGKIRGWLTA